MATIIEEAYLTREHYKNHLISFEVASKLLEPYAKFYYEKAKAIAKKYKKTAYPLNIKSFLGKPKQLA